MVKLYSDGACSGNPGPGGYGVILAYKAHYKELAGAYRHTTNNRMELMGVIVGLEALKWAPCKVSVYTDSSYLVNAIEKGWLRGWLKKGFKKKKNEDLWRRLWALYQRHQVRFHWIRGHNGHPQNERCDALAVAACREGPWLEDRGYNTENHQEECV